MEIVLKNIKVDFPDKTIKIKNKVILKNNAILIQAPNGKGKTTVLNILTKNQKYSGEIIIDNKNLKEYSHKEISRKISYIMQKDVLFKNLSIKENAEVFGFDKAVIQEYLEDFNLLTKFVTKVRKLSGGERQLINIIFGLAKPSEIILIDEPLNNLSIINKAKIKKKINADRRMKIVVSHIELGTTYRKFELTDGGMDEIITII